MVIQMCNTYVALSCLKTQVEYKPYLLPFMNPKDQSALGKLYQCIKNVMLNIHKTNGTREWIGKLVDLANDWLFKYPYIKH